MLTILSVLALTLCSCCGRIVSHWVCSVGWAGACSDQVRARRSMRDRLVSDEVDRLSWIGHFDSVFQARGATFATMVVAVLRVVWLVAAQPLDYRGKLRVLGTKIYSCSFAWYRGFSAVSEWSSQAPCCFCPCYSVSGTALGPRWYGSWNVGRTTGC